MSTRPASELLYDSEAALRLVDSAIEEIRNPDARRTHLSVDIASNAAARVPRCVTSHREVPIDPSQLFDRGYAEVVSMLGSLRESRAMLDRTPTEEEIGDASWVLAELEGRLAALAAALDAATPASRPVRV